MTNTMGRTTGSSAARKRGIVTGLLAALLSGVIGAAAAAGPVTARDAVPGEPLAVTFTDRSRTTRCAEEDNVDVRLRGSGVTSFRIIAQAPPYIATLTENRRDPDFTDCDFRSDPVFPATPATRTLYEDERYRLVGLTFESFWRPADARVAVGDGAGGDGAGGDGAGGDGAGGDGAGGDGAGEPGIHLLQLFTKATDPATEFLVLYPPDGYWRAKPQIPPNLDDNAYGSSFLVGPIVVDRRPLVDIRSVRFDPSIPAFRLRFADGGTATLSVVSTDAERTVLDVAFAAPIVGTDFAALRSMFVMADNADVAEARFRTAPGSAWGPVRPVLGFGSNEAFAGLFGRTLPSRHNVAAPDMIFERFRTKAGP